MKEQVTNLAQTMVRQVQNSVGYIKDPIQHYYAKPSNFRKEQPLFLAQMETPEYGSRSKLGDTGISSTKQMNTRGTLLLYFCVMTVLTCCCLGRCLIVPLTQASHFEINSRKHISKMDKNAFLQQEVVH